MLTAHALSSEALKQSIEMGARAYVPKEKMMDIPDFLEDVLSLEHGGSVRKTFQRLGGFFNKKFGSKWMEDETDVLGQGAERKLPPRSGDPEKVAPVGFREHSVITTCVFEETYLPGNPNRIPSKESVQKEGLNLSTKSQILIYLCPARPPRCGDPRPNHCDALDYGRFSEAGMVQRVGSGYLPAMTISAFHGT